MAEALRLDIVLNSDQAREALDQYEIALLKAGRTAGEAAKEVEKFERSIKDNAAKKEATKALGDIAKQHESGAEAATKQTKASDGLTAAIMRYAAPAAVGAAAIKTLEWADRITELAEQSKLTTTQVQQLERMASKNASSFGAMASLIQAAEQRLASHNKKAEEAVKILGLVPEKLLAMDPLERLRAIAKGLADLEDPAQRSALEVAILGRSANDATVALNALAGGADKAEGALGGDFIRAGNEAWGMLERIKQGALDAGRALLLLPGVIGNKAGEMGRDSTLGTIFEMMGLHGSRASKMPGLPGSPGGGWGMPNAAGAIDPLGGNSQSFIEKTLALVRSKKSGAVGAPVIPYTANQWAGMNAVYGNMMNPLGGIPGFPGWMTPPLMSSMSAQHMGLGFGRGNQMVPFAGTVPMNAPGSSGGFMNFLRGKGGAAAGMGLGLLSQLIPGLSGTGSSIGSMAGSFFGPLGSGIGSLAGGLLGKLFGGNKDKSQISALKGGEDFAAIKAKAEELGISMEKVFAAKKVEDFQKALKGVTDQISAQEGEQQKVLAAMEKWGLSIEDMGPKFKQTEMDKTAKSFTEDFMTLVGAGADVTTVIDKMGPSVGAFIQKSIEMGTTVPLEMKPIIEKMIEQGKLIDANGEKFTDLGQIPFAQDLNAQFSTLISKLDALISKVFGLGDAFDDATGSAGRFNDEAGNTRYDGDGGAVNVSRGGVIGDKGSVLYFKRGGFVPSGTDTVPAMLTPGEMVIARDTVKRMARGGGTRSLTVHLHVAGVVESSATQRRIADAVAESLDRDARLRRVG